MKTVNKLLFVAVMLATVVVLAVPAGQAQAVNEASLTIYVTFVGNHKAGNMTNTIYLGTTPYGVGQVTIPLTQNGVPIVDSHTSANVQGLHVERGYGYVILSAYGHHGSASREVIKANFSFSGTTITGAENIRTDVYEGQGDGLCKVVETDIKKSNVGNDEYTFSGSSGTICSITNVDSDNVKIFYGTNVPPPPPPPPVTCNSNSDCGTSGYIGSPFCGQSGNVYQTFRTYTCNNPGTANSTCAPPTDAEQLKNTCQSNQTCQSGSCTNVNIACSTASDCGNNAVEGNPFCQGNSIYKNFRTYTCNNPGTAYASCSSSVAPQLQSNCTGNQVCSITTGTCVNQTINCSTASECGANGYTGSPFCSNGDVYQNYTTYTCNNAGTANSSCSSNTAPQLKTDCTSSQTCQAGSCTTHDPLVVSAYTTPNPATTGQQVSFIANATGGTGSYSYTWTGECAGTGGQVCTKSFSTPGAHTATVTVTSGSQTVSYTASVTINQTCTAQSERRCYNGNAYWYDSCGNRDGLIQTCQYGCSGNQCNNYQQNCTYHSYQRCEGNYLYWYDSCDTRQDSQYCQYGCSNNYCNNYNYQNAQLTVTQTDRNLSSGNSSWSNTVYASPSDVISFMITIQAPTNCAANNVVVRDTMNSRLVYNNQMVVAGTSNYSGDIFSGLNINTISAGQTVTITYQAQLASASNFSYGTTTVSGNVSVSGSQSGYNPASNANVIVTRSVVYGASSISTGLTNNIWVDSFVLPLMLALLGLWMFRSGLFGFGKWADERKLKTANYKAEKQLQAKIAQIRKAETA